MSEQQRVLVTAGASGIGLAIAQHYLAMGAKVYICDINAAIIEQTLNNNEGIAGGVADVGNPGMVERFVAQAINEMGGVDVLVNNAGIGGPDAPVEDISYEDWDDCIRINLSGMFYMVKQVIPVMKKQQSGCIINISTSSVKTGLPNRLPYVASKAGVLGMTYNMARELGPYNIRCNSILPGMIDNERGRHLVQKIADKDGVSYEEAEQESLKYISMRTWIQPSEIAEVAYFLSSNAGRHVTGQEISVDGLSEWEE